MGLFAVVDPDGDLDDVEESLNSAVARAGELAPNVQIETAGAGEALGVFDAPPSDLVNIAVRNAGLPKLDFDDVMKLSLEEAYDTVVGLFPKERVRKSGEHVRVRAYDSPRGLAKTLLGQNWKTSKETPERPSDVQGLSLLPHRLALDTSSRRLPGGGLQLCVGSSQACRSACLVYSGHNTIDIYNMHVKLARTEALLLHPEAFIRLLAERIGMHVEKTKRSKYQPLVRLNVFSDVPWERIVLGLFEKFSELQFYDYTKVSGRDTPRNYDLTFSYSGTNHDRVRYEVREHRRRVAVVFLQPKGMKRIPAAKRTPGYGLPSTFWGLRVVDGDVSDVRPRDPAPSVVGLRWKLPHGQDIDLEKKENRAFVVPVEEYEGVLVASQSARQEPIIDPDSLDPDAVEE